MGHATPLQRQKRVHHRGVAGRAALDNLRVAGNRLGPGAVIGVNHQNTRQAGKGGQRMGQNRLAVQHLPLLRQIAARAGSAPGGDDDGNRMIRTVHAYLLGHGAEHDNQALKIGTTAQNLCKA